MSQHLLLLSLIWWTHYDYFNWHRFNYNEKPSLRQVFSYVFAKVYSTFFLYLFHSVSILFFFQLFFFHSETASDFELSTYAQWISTCLNVDNLPVFDRKAAFFVQIRLFRSSFDKKQDIVVWGRVIHKMWITLLIIFTKLSRFDYCHWKKDRFGIQ